MSYCPKCGSKNDDDAKFCGECGAALVVETKTSLSSQSQQQPASVLNEPTAKKMYCRNCGNEVLPNAFACTSCGLPPLKGKTHCQNCGADCHPYAVICIKCGVKLGTTGIS